MQARTGVARLALATDAPVVPVAHWGPQHAVDVEHKRIRPLPRHEVWSRGRPAARPVRVPRAAADRATCCAR